MFAACESHGRRYATSVPEVGRLNPTVSNRRTSAFLELAHVDAC